MQLDFGQGEKELVVSIYTMVLYEQEFHSDMIKDVFGKVVIKDDSDLEEGVIDVLDYRSINWTALTRALWASLKAADDSIHPYDEWVRELGDVNLWKLCGPFYGELRRRLFHSGDTASE